MDLACICTKKGVMSLWAAESEQRCGGSQVLIAWPGGLRCWYGFSASFVPECDATCVVGRQLFYVYIKHSPS